MRKGGGKAKGSAFEREVCVRLSKWLTSGKQDDVFWRSAMSGGRATVAAKKGGKRLSNQVGDISCIDPVGSKFIEKFGVECKFYNDLDYTGLLTGRGKLLSFWEEICIQSAYHYKQPFLVAKQNRQPATVCLSYHGTCVLGIDWREALVISPKPDIYIYDADYFFKACTPYVDDSRRHSPDRQRKRRVPLRAV